MYKISFLVKVACFVFISGQVLAEPEPNAEAPEIKDLKQQVQLLKERLDKLPYGPPAKAEKNSSENESLTFVVAKTLIQLYGHLDLSVDAMTKGIDGRTIVSGDVSNPNASGVYTAQGHLGWLPDISSNLSYFGIRGNHTLSDDLNIVFQIETQVDVAATPGTSDNNASADNGVKGAFASRNSFLGVAGSSWGSIKLGKTDTPYKLSTARLDPFAATVGDYNSIMGNSGGDNRAEFDPRLSHAVWYDSPNFNGFALSFLYSPGQNRTDNDQDIAAGEPSCTGQNNPINGGQICGDGSFGDAWSLASSYQGGSFFGTVAAEFHGNVNRTGDETGFGGGAPPGSVGVANEWAIKAGTQFQLPTQTTLNLIFENMVRYAPNPNYNERTRIGWWVAGTQKIDETNNINLGWGHAGNTPGDPGDPTVVGPDGTTSGGPKANAADLLTLGYLHAFPNHRTTIYAVYAMTINQRDAHYDLGASGHGIMTDCRDGALNAGGFAGGGGICFTGSTLQAASVGMTHDF